jgi:hypothetical protein
MSGEPSITDKPSANGSTEVEADSIESTSANRGCRRIGCLLAVGGFVYLAFFSPVWMMVLSLLEPPWRLATGWWSFLSRWRSAGGAIIWSDVALATVFLIVLIAGSHWLARWIARHQQFASWKFSTTAKSVGAVLAVSLAGIALLGITHQVFWMATTKSRMTHSTGHEIRGRMQSVNYLRGIALTLHKYERLHYEFPPGGNFGEDGRPMHSWVTFLLPYWSEETDGLVDEIDPDQPWDSEANRHAMQRSVTLLNVHSQGPSHTSDGYATSHFAANASLFLPNQPFTTADVSDGIANTVLLGDVRFRHKAWGDPTNTRDLTLGVNQQADGFGSNFAGGAHFLMGDGSTRFLSDRTDPEVLKAFATLAGGEEVDTSARPYRVKAAR